MEYELYHHGILGMHWGIRRYQNKDGSLTAAGRNRYKNIFGKTKKSAYEDYDKLLRTARNEAASNSKDVVSILNTFSEKDQDMINIYNQTTRSAYGGNKAYAEDAYRTKRFVEKIGKTPVSFFDLQISSDYANVVIGSRNGSRYRNKGYASAVAKKGLDWIENNKDLLSAVGVDEVTWWAYSNNTGSRKLAEKYGFEKQYEESNYGYPGRYGYKGPKDVKYIKKIG